MVKRNTRRCPINKITRLEVDLADTNLNVLGVYLKAKAAVDILKKEAFCEILANIL